MSKPQATELLALALPILRELKLTGRVLRRVFLYEECLKALDCTYEIAQALNDHGLVKLGLSRPPDAGPYDPKVIDTEFHVTITPAGLFVLAACGERSTT